MTSSVMGQRRAGCWRKLLRNSAPVRHQYQLIYIQYLEHTLPHNYVKQFTRTRAVYQSVVPECFGLCQEAPFDKWVIVGQTGQACDGFSDEDQAEDEEQGAEEGICGEEGGQAVLLGQQNPVIGCPWAFKETCQNYNVHSHLIRATSLQTPLNSMAQPPVSIVAPSSSTPWVVRKNTQKVATVIPGKIVLVWWGGR